MSFKYNAEDNFPSFPESFVFYTLDGDAQGADDKTLICPSLVGHSILLPTNDESHLTPVNVLTPVNDNNAVSSQLGGSGPVNHTNRYFFPYYTWVALEEIHSEQSPSASDMTSYISPQSADRNQQVEILFHQQITQSLGACGLQECTLNDNDEVHAKNCHDEGVLNKQLTDSDSKNSVMSKFFCDTDTSYRRDDFTSAGPTEVSAKFKNSKCPQFSKTAEKRRGECREECECIAKRCRMDAEVGCTPHLLSKVDKVTTEIIQLAPSCGQVVEVLRRSTIGHGQDIVYVQNEVTPWEPWVTALRDEEGTLTVSPCSSRSSLIEMDGDIEMKMVKEETNGETVPSLQQSSRCEAQRVRLCMQVKRDLKGKCHQIVGSQSVMLPSLHKSEDHLNQMQDNNIESCIAEDTCEDIYKTLVDGNYSDESLNSLHLFEELRDLESEGIVLQDTDTFEHSINGFSQTQNHCGKVLSDRTEDVCSDITLEQRHIQDKCAFLLLEAERELRKMGIRGFSVRLNTDWHQLVVEDSYFGNTFIFPLDEVDFNDRNPIFEDILDRLTKDMYSILSCACNHEVRV